MSEHRWSEQVVPYALGELTGAERAGFEAHLDECEICRRELREMNEVGKFLAQGAPSASPPGRLRERILSDARKSQSDAGAASGTSVGGSASDELLERRLKKSAENRQPARMNFIPWLATAASIALAVVSFYSASADRRAREDFARAYDDARVALAGRDSLLATLLSPDLRLANLSDPTAASPLRLFMDPARRRVIMIARNLPPAPDGRDYQLWGIAAGGTPVSLGVFNTNSDGSLIHTVEIPEGLDPAIGAVSVEPDGGSAQPSAQPILVGNWRKVE